MAEDIAWAAGLFEGEGCVRIRTSGRRYKNGGISTTPSLYVGSTDLDVLQRFHKIVGGGSISGPYRNKPNPKYKKPQKQIWQWLATWKQARRIAPLLYPFLGMRRRTKMEEVFGKESFNG